MVTRRLYIRVDAALSAKVFGPLDAQVHAARAKALWAELASWGPSEPDITLDEGVKFTWMNDRYTLEVESLADGRTAWYFRDATLPLGQSEGDDVEPGQELPARFWECLARAGGARGGR